MPTATFPLILTQSQRKAVAKILPSFAARLKIEEKASRTIKFSLAELEKIVSQIESGQIGLEESITRYEEGIRLIKQCRAILDAAEKRIQLLAKGEGDQLQPAGELQPPDEEQA